MANHDQIRGRAYFLWEKAGRPHDRRDEFWHQAVAELTQSGAAAAAPAATQQSAAAATARPASKAQLREPAKKSAKPKSPAKPKA